LRFGRATDEAVGMAMFRILWPFVECRAIATSTISELRWVFGRRIVSREL
jgi:hypothetical protein